MNTPLHCIECGEEMSEERVRLGYRYCTGPACQAVHHRGLTVTAVGVNKSADNLIVGDVDEIRRRGETGEFAKKDSGLGLDYRAGGVASAPSERHRARPQQRATRPRRAWTTEQEKIVRLYHDMGLSPRRIAERARENAPRLGITERLAVQILSGHGRR